MSVTPYSLRRDDALTVCIDVGTSPSTHITMWTGIPTWDIAMFAAIASLASCDVMWPGYIGLTGTRFGLVPISAFVLNGVLARNRYMITI